jgi:hypothetical protein
MATFQGVSADTILRNVKARFGFSVVIGGFHSWVVVISYGA